MLRQRFDVGRQLGSVDLADLLITHGQNSESHKKQLVAIVSWPVAGKQICKIASNLEHGQD